MADDVRADLDAAYEAIRAAFAAGNLRRDRIRADQGRGHRVLCRLGVHPRMSEAVADGMVPPLGHVERFECYCGKAYWLSDDLGMIRQ